MAKTKYKKDFPKRAEEYAKQGMIDKEIAKKLGIHPDTFYEYIKKYPDFSESIVRGKLPVDEQVEQALLKRALGFEYEETSVEYNKQPVIPGMPIPPSVRTVKKTTKRVVPDVTAEKFWLINRKPKRWREQTHETVKIVGASIEEMNKNLKEATKDD